MKALLIFGAVFVLIYNYYYSQDEDLGPGLVLENDDRSHVYLYKKAAPFNEIIIDWQIVDILSKNGLAFVLRKVVRSYECEEPDKPGIWSIISYHSPESEYYIVGIADQKVHGPLTKADFDVLIAQRHIRLRRPLNEGNYYSDTEAFEKMRLGCKNIRPI